MSLDDVRRRMSEACHRSGRDPEGLTLVAVTKGRSAEAIQELFERGVRDFGENRAQELVAKIDALPAALLAEVRWHFIGPLQTNKVRLVRPSVVMLHSMDRDDLGRAWLKGPGLAPPAMLQVNIGREPQKHGFDPDEVMAAADRLIALGVRLEGLMAIPPIAEDPEEARPFFHALRELRDRVVERHQGCSGLSMGMTDDFEVAVEEGATCIRVGRAIFQA